MEELDLLKKDWKKNEDKFPKISEKEIYAMLHKKSSSIVKWLLIISFLEFLFSLSMSFVLKDSPSTKKIDSLQADYITVPLTIISYGITIYFFCLFYINYRKITATDNVKNLMSAILKTRKTVSNYIFINIGYIIVSCITIFIVYFNKDTDLINALHRSEERGKALTFYAIYIMFALLTLAVFIVIVWAFYKLLYGLLLKRLKRNYEELKKIDL